MWARAVRQCPREGGDRNRSAPREHTQVGLGSARKAGSTGGRPPKLTDDDIEAAKAMLTDPIFGTVSVAHCVGVSRAALYRYIPAARASTNEATVPT